MATQNGMTAAQAQHAIVYLQSTSDIKDDVPALLAVMKSGQGSLTRQEAAFLVWHHAMNSGDKKQEELLNYSCPSVCLVLLDARPDDVHVPEKTCAAGILYAICRQGDDACEAVARARLPGGAVAASVLHNVLGAYSGPLQLFAAKVLRCLASTSTTKTMALRGMDNQLLLASLYRRLLESCRDAHVVGQLALGTAEIVRHREDVRRLMVEAGIVDTLLHVMRTRKMDSAVRAALNSLLILLEATPAATARIAELPEASRLLVDLLGPPPKAIMEAEKKEYPALLDPDYSRIQKLMTEDNKPGGDTPGGPAATDATGPDADAAATSSKSLATSTTIKRAGTMTGSRSTVGAGDQGGPDGEEAAPGVATDTVQAQQQQPGVAAVGKAAAVDTRHVLSLNSCALKWHALSSSQTRCLAAGCVYACMAHDLELMHRMSDLLATSRVVSLLHRVVDEASQAGGKKGAKKKRGLVLGPEQMLDLVHVTGCLKFLSLTNPNRYRIAAMGATPLLVQLASEAKHTLLRRNAQTVLSNLVLLAEAAPFLKEGGVPDENLVLHPMRLTPAEVAELLKEFPGASISAPKPATTGLVIKAGAVKAV